MSSTRLSGVGAVLQVDQVLDRGEDVVGAQRRQVAKQGNLLCPDPRDPSVCHSTYSSGSKLSLWLTLSRPTRDRSYRSGLKKRLRKRLVAVSRVGGSPGRRRR